MLDLEMTDNGDLAWSSVSSSGAFHLRFALADYKTQHIHFLCRPTSCLQNKHRKGQHIRFCFAEPGEEFKVQTGLVQNEDERLQALYIALRTELGDVNDDTVGSDFYKEAHHIIADANDLSAIRDKAAEVVERFFPGSVLEAEYSICPEAKNFKYQSVKFIIKDKNNEVVASFVF